LTGRRQPFGGSLYSTVAVFPDHLDEFPHEAWSVSVHLESPPTEQGNPSIGVAEFLASEAPHDRLRPGAFFELYEGPRLTAVVEVLGKDQ
jgi:hypothetical protein